MPKIVILIAACLLAFLHTLECCDVNTITSRVSNCLNLPLDETSAERVDAVCQNVECNIQCILEAVGSCQTEDAFFAYEPEVVKVTYRAICANPEAAKVMFRSCSTSGSLCMETFATSLVNTSLPAYASKNYTGYKYETCSAMNAVLSCLHVPVTSECPAVIANYAENYLSASFSYASCGATQDHAYFRSYAGDVTCGCDHVVVTWY